jgi:hypothetical protein
VWADFIKQLSIQEIIASKVKDDRPKLPWSNELEFCVSCAPPTEIKAKDLLATILP